MTDLVQVYNADAACISICYSGQQGAAIMLHKCHCLWLDVCIYNEYFCLFNFVYIQWLKRWS